MKIPTIATIALLLSSCASQVQLPNNVSIRETGSAAYIDKVRFTYQTGSNTDFSKLKLCIAENITNDSVIIKDSADSWVGPATGNYYRNTDSQVISGKSIFKYVDDKNSTLITDGTTTYSNGGILPTNQFVRFNLKTAIKDGSVILLFSNIKRAQQNTGLLSNDGFTPVGAWAGADAKGTYEQLENVANSIKSCIGS